MKYHILNDFGISTPFKKNIHFKGTETRDRFGTQSDLISGRVVNNVLNPKFLTPPGNQVRLTSNFVKSFSVYEDF